MQLTHSWLPTRGVVRRSAAVCLVLGLALPLAIAGRASAAPNATITGSFADSCSEFAAISTKDISYVEIHYADGRIARNEAVDAPRYAIEGNTGDEITLVKVKSGITTQTFPCTGTNSPPSAILEVRLTPACSEPYTSSSGETFYWCRDGQPNDQRTVFVHPGDLRVDLLCDFTTENLPCTTVTFGGTTSTDPDDDIASWSIDFDDGIVATGGWTTAPPKEVTHEYHPRAASCSGGICNVILTVTDSGGRTHTDTVTLVFVDATPD